MDMYTLHGGQCIRLSEFSRGRACADYTGRYARKEDVVQAENGRDGNDSMSAASEGFLSSSDDEDEPPTTGEADL